MMKPPTVSFVSFHLNIEFGAHDFYVLQHHTKVAVLSEFVRKLKHSSVKIFIS